MSDEWLKTICIRSRPGSYHRLGNDGQQARLLSNE